MEADLEAKLTFVNKTSLLIAYERAIETDREDALFKDPYAKLFAGTSGKEISDMLAERFADFGLKDWKGYHVTWTAVRTKFIDDWITQTVNDTPTNQLYQIVNLGAGVDLRPFRLDCLKRNATMWEVDLPEVNEVKEVVIKAVGMPDSVCKRTLVDCDLSEDTLSSLLSTNSFDSNSVSHFLLEGIIMYLPKESQKKLIQQVTALCAPGSTALINYQDVEHELYMARTFRKEEFIEFFNEGGWEVTSYTYGDETLNYGRYPNETEEPCRPFSFFLLRKK